jgi:hypothetical protein
VKLDAHLWLVLATTLAGCKSLPDIPTGICGNHVLDPGEECDSGDDPNCAPAGSRDQCHRRCGSGGACAPGELCADSGFCRPTANVCGNLIVEPGEDCDTTNDNCGPPTSGRRACRFVCGGGLLCVAGAGCGSDGICRFGTGTYTLGPVVGTSADQFGVTDLDGDGVPDLVARQPGHAAFYRNDGAGALSRFAEGAMHGWPSSLPLPGIDRAHPAGEPLWAAVTSQGLELFTLEPPNRLVPLGGAAALLPTTATGSQRFLGAVRRDDDVGTEALYYDSSSRQLVTYPVPQFYSDQGATLAQMSTFDLAKCAPLGDVVWSNIQTTGEGLSTVVVEIGQSSFCALVADGQGGWTAAPLKPPLTPGGGFSWRALVGDVDGNGQADVVLTSFSTVGPTPAAVFLRVGDTFKPPVLVNIAGVFKSNLATAMADFNSDGRDDFLIDGDILVNETVGSEASFSVGKGFVELGKNPQVEAFGRIEKSLAGDLNNDKQADIVLANSSPSNNLEVCLGDGTGKRFTCALESTGVDHPSDVFLADVNADRVNDIVAVAGMSSSSGLDQPGLAVLLGRPFALPDPNALPLHVYHDRLTGAAALPSASIIASDLIAAIHTSDGRDGVALARGDPQALAFAFPFAPPFTDVRDMRMVDDDGDGKPDVAMLDGGGITILYGNGSGGLAGGMKSFTGNLPNARAGKSRFASLGGDPLTVVGWDHQGLWIVHRVDNALQATVTADATLQAPLLLDRDLDGDGENELVVFDAGAASAGGDCAVYLGRFILGAPAKLTRSPSIHDCALGLRMLVDVPPLDGRLDLIVSLKGSGNAGENVVVMRQIGDDLFDVNHPEPMPSLLRDGGASVDDPSSWAWVDSVDMNGDGIVDVIVRGPLGARVALADVRLR